jgi:Asp-tRNA(Asn)/Glu-tRNA(Gln) amidotransferase A subunit family amidase
MDSHVVTTGLLETFLTRGRPGRALTLLARAPIPVLTPDRFAELSPGPKLPAGAPSPLVEGNALRPAITGGLLDGGVVIKDQIDVAGMRTGVGLPDGGEVASHDAVLVARIVAAGGHIRGKAKMTELGMDGIGALMHYPMPRNPRAPDYIPGGSSTGTAVAVASGLARYGVGGDGLGSIRIPAAFCGLVGLKPTRTRIPRDGIHSPVRTLDAVGPITRTVDDCARLWQVMAGEPITQLSPAVPPRLGVPILRVPWHVSRSVWAAFTRALAAFEAEIEHVELRGLESATFLGGMIGAHELSTGPFASRTSSRAGRMSVALGRAFSPENVERLERQRDDLRTATERVLERTPILAMPTAAIPPPALSRALLEGRLNVMLIRAIGAFTPLANLVDLPAIAVPCGVDDRDRPLSIMFVAARNHETDLLRLALALEHTNLGTKPIS